MVIENTRWVVRNLLLKTESREIRWVNIFENSDKLKFQFIKKITNKKFLKFVLTSTRVKSHSDLTITFGPVNVEEPFGPKERETLVSIITTSNQPLLYDLVDSLNRKYNEGDIQYISESMSFSPTDEAGKERSDKLKNLKLLSTLVKDTDSGKLMWENTFSDKISSSFLAKIAITKMKKLVMTLRTTNGSEIIEDNILKVILKKDNTDPGSGGGISVIKSISLKEYPALIVLIKRLNKKYLERDFESPFIVTEKPKDVGNSRLVIANNPDEYRKYIQETIKGYMRELPQSINWEDAFVELNDLYQECKETSDYDKLNDLLFKAHTINLKRMNAIRMNAIKNRKPTKNEGPIGTPRWAR
jgi:hypothetical protein